MKSYILYQDEGTGRKKNLICKNKDIWADKKKNETENFESLYPFGFPCPSESTFLLVSEGTSISVTGSKVV